MWFLKNRGIVLLEGTELVCGSDLRVPLDDCLRVKRVFVCVSICLYMLKAFLRTAVSGSVVERMYTGNVLNAN